jgi:hypothetical protein
MTPASTSRMRTRPTAVAAQSSLILNPGVAGAGLGASGGWVDRSILPSDVLLNH